MRSCLSFSIFVLLLIVQISGCKTKTDSIFPTNVFLEGKMLSVGDSLGSVLTLEAVDDYLLFLDNHEHTLFSILNPDLSYCFRFGRIGQGPGEMPSNSSGVMMIRNGFLTLSDGFKLYQHRLDSLFHSVDNPIVAPRSEINDAMIWVTPLTDSLFVASGTFPNGKRFKVLDRSGKVYGYMGDYPLEENTELPFYIVGISYLSTMTSHPVSNRFALGTQYGGMLDVMEWDQQDSILRRVGGICEFKPRLTSKDYMGTPNFAPDARTRWGYIYLDSDAEYIYALYSGRFVQEKDSRKCNTVHVFDWQGKPVCQVKLDKYVKDIAVVKNKLYALYEDADIGYEVIEYVLPDNWMKK